MEVSQPQLLRKTDKIRGDNKMMDKVEEMAVAGEEVDSGKVARDNDNDSSDLRDDHIARPLSMVRRAMSEIVA
jgi:hypothetical protein